MLINFLKTKRSVNDLKTALEILKEFKKCESSNEWLQVPFLAWIKLEQFEEFLEHLTNGQTLKADTLKEIKKRTTN